MRAVPLVIASGLACSCASYSLDALRVPYTDQGLLVVDCAKFPASEEEINSRLSQLYANGWRLASTGKFKTLLSSDLFLCFERPAGMKDIEPPPPPPKPAPAPKKAVKAAPVDDSDDSADDAAPPPKKAQPAKKKAKPADDDSSDGSADTAPPPKKDAAAARKAPPPQAASDDGSDDAPPPKKTAKKAAAADDSTADDTSDVDAGPPAPRPRRHILTGD